MPEGDAQWLRLYGMGRLWEAVQERDRLTEMIQELGRDLVLAGISYAEIARALGITRQSAYDRWSGAVGAWQEGHGDEKPWETWEPQEEGAPEGVLEVQLAAEGNRLRRKGSAG